jgi:hypothetical protein
LELSLKGWRFFLTVATFHAVALVAAVDVLLHLCFPQHFFMCTLADLLAAHKIEQFRNTFILMHTFSVGELDFDNVALEQPITLQNLSFCLD